MSAAGRRKFGPDEREDGPGPDNELDRWKFYPPQMKNARWQLLDSPIEARRLNHDECGTDLRAMAMKNRKQRSKVTLAGGKSNINPHQSVPRCLVLCKATWPCCVNETTLYADALQPPTAASQVSVTGSCSGRVIHSRWRSRADAAADRRCGSSTNFFISTLSSAKPICREMVLFTTKDPFSPAAFSRADLAAGDPACFPAHHTVR